MSYKKPNLDFADISAIHTNQAVEILPVQNSNNLPCRCTPVGDNSTLGVCVPPVCFDPPNTFGRLPHPHFSCHLQVVSSCVNRCCASHPTAELMTRRHQALPTAGSGAIAGNKCPAPRFRRKRRGVRGMGMAATESERRREDYPSSSGIVDITWVRPLFKRDLFISRSTENVQIIFDGFFVRSRNVSKKLLQDTDLHGRACCDIS